MPSAGCRISGGTFDNRRQKQQTGITERIVEPTENRQIVQSAQEAGFSRLLQNLMDAVKEEQVKLGYRSEVIRLYYPVDSVKRMLETGKTAEIQATGGADDRKYKYTDSENIQNSRNAIKESFSAFRSFAEGRIGSLDISYEPDGNRVCFRLSEDYAEYVHSHTPQSGFIYDFIAAIARHGSKMDDIIEVFRRYSEHVHVERLEHDEFDCLVYFEDGIPDSYRYCLTDEGFHISYHRFTTADYEALGIGRE